MKIDRLVSCLIVCLGLLVNGPVAARTLGELQGDDRLRIRTWIEPQEDIIARQQLNLQIEVATDRWFSSGTRIGHFEVKDAIVLQREKFAVNSTLIEGDKTWTVQLWTLVVYPQRGGVFEIPPIPLGISVADDNSESVVGEISTRRLNFVARIPQSLVASSAWVATDRFEVAEKFSKSFDELQPGDALIRTINLSADNLSAMMLPQVRKDSIPGIAVYPGPVQINDKVNRGDYIAERTEIFTYVFEKSGDYRLPEQTFHWWDLTSQSARSIVLEERLISVVGAGVGGEITVKGTNNETAGNGLSLLIIKAMAGLALAFLTWFAIGKFKKHRWRKVSLQPARPIAKELPKEFQRACRQKQYDKALRLLYQLLDNNGGEAVNGVMRDHLVASRQNELSQLFNKLMRSVYGQVEFDPADLELFASHYLRGLNKGDYSLKVRTPPVDFSLN